SGCPSIHLQTQFLADYFTPIHAPSSGGTLAFLLTQTIPTDLLAVDLLRELSVSQASQLMDEAARPLGGFWRLFVLTAKAQMLVGYQCFNEARELVMKIRKSSHSSVVVEWDVAQIEAQLPPVPPPRF